MAFTSLFALLFLTATATTAATPTTVPPHIDNLVSAVISTGNFQNWASLLSSSPPTLPPNFTLFIPITTATNTTVPPSFLNHNHPFSTANDDQDLPFHHHNNKNSQFSTKTREFLHSYTLLLYHTVPHRLSYSDITRLPSSTRFDTLLQNSPIHVSKKKSSVSCNFTIEGSCITHPNLYQFESFFVHGIATAMDYTPKKNKEKKAPSSWVEMWRKLLSIPTSYAQDILFHPLNIIPIINGGGNDELLVELVQLRLLSGFVTWQFKFVGLHEELVKETEMMVMINVESVNETYY
ncbi:hypothetical protein vseg_019991 [Gypsophila vaccaria]